MGIGKKPPLPPVETPKGSEEGLQRFIDGAPDAAKPSVSEAAPAPAPAQRKPGGVKRGKKYQIALTMGGELMLQVEEIAERTGQTRTAVINLGVFKAIQAGLIG